MSLSSNLINAWHAFCKIITLHTVVSEVLDIFKQTDCFGQHVSHPGSFSSMSAAEKKHLFGEICVWLGSTSNLVSFLCFPFKDMRMKSTGYSELSIGVNGSVNG